jgi:hypothetical protein
MNREKYNGDPRYAKVLEKMDLLGIMDITTTRQNKNGTIVWKLPIKYGKDRFIEVASFATGYVRNQNGGYTNYQLNKRCESEPQYYKCTNKHDGSDLYRKYTTRTCKLIPIEINRLEYLISYCIKNYYIKRANEVANGDYIPKWTYEHRLEQAKRKYDDLADAARLDYDCGHYDRINDLEEKLENMTEARDCYKNSFDDLQDGGDYRIKDLENKLDTIKRIADHG